MFKNIPHLLEGIKVKIKGKENSNTSRIVKVQATPGGILADMVKESLDLVGLKRCIKVMEEEGIPITACPRKNDPSFQGSGRFSYPHCITEDCKDCAAMYVIYEITCNSCQQSVSNESKRSREPGKQVCKNYIGMTMTSSNCKMVSHLGGQRTKSIKNSLWRYDKNAHDGQICLSGNYFRVV